MNFETCPLLDGLPWIKHGFFNRHQALTNDVAGFHSFTPEFQKTFFLKQDHTDCIAMTLDDACGLADASITVDPDIALAVKTADCAPVLLVCPQTKIIAAVHAGWPGTLKQIVFKTVKQMKERGADPACMIAAIGPCLHKDSFAIQADVRDKFQGQLPEAMDMIEPFEDRWKMDMVGILKLQLKKAGVCHIWASSTDTYKNHDFASYRRRNQDPDSAKKRNISIVMKINP